MNTASRSLVALLAVLNPFALCLYLTGVMDQFDLTGFLRVFLRASAISLVAFWAFAAAGEPLLVDYLSVRPEALRAFGGVVFFVVAYGYVTRGHGAVEFLRGEVGRLPGAIALPFMIGAGTITQAILIGKSHRGPAALAVIALGIGTCVVVVTGFKFVRDRMREAHEATLERYVDILARVNGLVIGAVSTQMVVLGVRSLWETG
jgi:multiple antibiotic resistance protein